MNNRSFFLNSSGGWKCKIKTPADSTSGEGPRPTSSMAVFSLCPHMAEGRGALWSLFHKGANPFMRAPTLWLRHLSNAPPPNNVTLRISFQDKNLGGTKHLVYSNCDGSVVLQRLRKWRGEDGRHKATVCGCAWYQLYRVTFVNGHSHSTVVLNAHPPHRCGVRKISSCLIAIFFQQSTPTVHLMRTDTCLSFSPPQLLT